MRLFYNEASQVDYDTFNQEATLNDLLQAIDKFIEQYPLSCIQCQEGCCKKPWAVAVDNVSARCLSVEAGISLSEYVSEMLDIAENNFLDFEQYVFKKKSAQCPWITESNRCQIYENRPLICRLYICPEKSLRYNQLREASAATFLQALVFEQIIERQKPTASQLKYFKLNPALNARDYSLKLQKIIDYAMDQGWI